MLDRLPWPSSVPMLDSMEPSDQRWMLFSDESGIGPDYKCYGIGLFVLREDRLDAFNDWFQQLRANHGVRSEVKWKRIDNKSHGRINLAIDLLKALFRSHARFEIIVVHKGHYRLWTAAQRERAFYKSFTQLLRHRLRLDKAEYTVLMDERLDSYPKHDEVVEKITNYMAAKISAQGRLTSVSKADSKLTPGIQFADVLCGAVTAASNLYLDPSAPLSVGKRAAIERLAAVLGWDALHYDTYPSDKFNVWHFPEEWRADPATRPISLDQDVPYVDAEELRIARESKGR